ncbi:MAG: hypothetical protein WBX16_01975, partial [Candidatus Acidiferrales bacterium]
PCTRPKSGLGRLCLGHRREMEAKKLSSSHDSEIVLPERNRFEWQGDEASLIAASETANG